MSEQATYYGKDCPAGMVQVEFVGIDPKLRYSDYGWKPCDRAFLEIWVDGQRFRIEVGTFESAHGLRRGIQIITNSSDLQVDKNSVNAVDIYLAKEATHA